MYRNGAKIAHRPLRAQLRRRLRMIVAAAVLVVAAAGGLIVFTLEHNKTTHIIDDPIGLSFSISNSFSQIGSTALSQLNPYNVYGFEIKDVVGVMCVISQTSKGKPGVVAPEALADGAFRQIKLSYPDVQPLGYKAVKLKNSRDAASFDVSYHNNGAAFRQAEVVAVTDTHTTFAYCVSPAALFNQYKAKFNNFFLSLEVY